MADPLWSSEQVLALASDTSSVAAGRKLAEPRRWSELGSADRAVWGQCAGSGAHPYQVIVDLTGPAYRCTCPSRKFPCKHALALLLLWCSGQVADHAAPALFAEPWLTKRRSATAPERPRTGGVVDPGAAAARARQRTERVSGGLAELERWIADQVRDGLAGADRLGYSDVDRMAARLVDAQAQPVATAVRGLVGLRTRPDWPERVLAEYAMLRLLALAHARLEELPAGLAANVRARVGYTTSREAVLATPGLTDSWHVLAQEDTEDDRVSTRRIWLAGTKSGRFAVLLSFAVADRAFDLSMSPGTAFEGTLHFYPGDPPLRALAAERRRPLDPSSTPQLSGGSVAAALQQWSAALTADPWATSWPVLLGEVLPVATEHAVQLVDATGATPPLRADGIGYDELLAVSGGRPIAVFGELTVDRFRARRIVSGDD